MFSFNGDAVWSACTEPSTFDDADDCGQNKLGPLKFMQRLNVFQVQQAANTQKVLDLPESAVFISDGNTLRFFRGLVTIEADVSESSCWRWESVEAFAAKLAAHM